MLEAKSGTQHWDQDQKEAKKNRSKRDQPARHEQRRHPAGASENLVPN